MPPQSKDALLIFVTDTIVDGLYGERVFSAMTTAGFKWKKLVVAPKKGRSGDPAEIVTALSSCLEEVLHSEITPQSCIIALGGSWVMRLCTALAPIICGGLHMVHIPTTLTGMLGAAIDMNYDIGCHVSRSEYLATMVVIDPETLSSLATRHIRSGLAESLKYGICCMRSLVDAVLLLHREHWRLFEEAGQRPQEEVPLLEHTIRLYMQKKLSMHHRTNHASEVGRLAAQYGRVLGDIAYRLSWRSGPSEHGLLTGEAQSIGMCLSAEVGYIRGFCPVEVVEEHYKLLSSVGLCGTLPNYIDKDDFVDEAAVVAYWPMEVSCGFCPEIGRIVAALDPSADDTTLRELLSEPVVLRAALSANATRNSSRIKDI
eukprot:NODE_5568_length_1756_cov_8.737262.p1 GENE.NODE_5568_length_1756_cov_8.737262~~NODE_5568_length_1756_cov_8.737262.p1  ORF type:complete len:372 (+),score=99.99 NODE_5568_length_1756_cov_8.737262:515-1630(+)